MISGSAALSASNSTTGSLSYINTLVSDATSSGSYFIIVPSKYMNDTMASTLKNVYGYDVNARYSNSGGSYVDYRISWGTITDPTPTPLPTSTPTPTPTPTPAPTSTPAPTATPLPTATPAPTATPIPATATPTPTPASIYQSYDYVISATDLAAATGNTGANLSYNNKVVVVITNGYNCGNTTERNFTYSFSSAGSFISWLISRKTDVPVIGYYKDDVLVTTGVLSTQTANATVPC